MDRFGKNLDDFNMRRDGRRSDRIQSYNLYGEQGDLPDVVHCETIAARSVLNGWTFPPHRHDRLHQVLMIETGGGTATIDGVEFRLSPMSIINVAAGHVHEYAFKRGTVGFVVTIAAEVLDEVLAPGEGLRRELTRSMVMRADPAMRSVFKGIFREYGARDYARAHVLRGLTAVLIGLVARGLASGRATPSQDGGALFARFEALIDAHYLAHWRVADYASALSVTPTHLTRTARAASDRTATQLIMDRIVREARRNLVYTNLPVATVAFALGFSDPAYFSRLFAKATGMSPRTFRSKAAVGSR